MNFHKSNVKTVSLVMLAASLAGTILAGNAWAQESGMSIFVDADGGSDVFSVRGQTALLNDVALRVTAPNGNLVFADQITPDSNGLYETDVRIGGVIKQDGWYTVSAQQANAAIYRVSVLVQVAGGAAVETSESESSLQYPVDIPRPTLIDDGLVFTADAPEGATVIGIDGSTDRINVDVTLIVEAPNGNVIATDQMTPDQNGDFGTVINVGCPSWKQDGFYTITLQQAQSSFYKASTQVEVIDCVIIPEFGPIAVLVLAVAIVSIIAITARSRLNIMPRL